MSADPRRSGTRTACQRAGDAAEDRALAMLAARGCRPIARNVRCRAGEIDLVVRDGDAVVFVEVRARSRAEWGGAAASVTVAKQRRVLRAAQWWLLRRFGDAAWPPCRFDVVAVDAGGRLDWIRAAFDAG